MHDWTKKYSLFPMGSFWNLTLCSLRGIPHRLCASSRHSTFWLGKGRGRGCGRGRIPTYWYLKASLYAHPMHSEYSNAVCFALSLDLYSTWKCCQCGESICETGSSKLAVTVSVCCLPCLKQETKVAPPSSCISGNRCHIFHSVPQNIQVVSVPQSI